MNVGGDGPAIVYVHLGVNPAPTLISFSNLIHETFENAETFLITDQPKRFINFQGSIVKYGSEDRAEAVIKLESKFPHYRTMAGGYWIRTIERLFAISVLEKVIGEKRSFLHFESDVISFINLEIYTLLLNEFKKVAFPRYSKDTGIASVLFSPSSQEYKLFLSFLSKEIFLQKNWQSDMDLLGKSLNSGVSSELPSYYPINNPLVTQNYSQVVFDGAAFGQYLLGRDPVHTNGKAISGYQNPEFQLKLSESQWGLQVNSSKKIKSIKILTDKKEEFEILNLHVHSKTELTSLNSLDPFWNRIMVSANNIDSPIVGEETRDDIHTIRARLRDRFSLAKQKGLIKVIKRKILQILFLRKGNL